MSSPSRRPEAPQPETGQDTVRIGDVDTERYTAADRPRSRGRRTLVLWTPVLLLVDLVDGVLGRAGGLLMIAFLAAAVHVGVAVLPPYVAYYAFKDEVAEIGRYPTYDDGRVRSALLDAIHRRKLGAFVAPEGFEVTLSGDRRRVAGSYRVPIRLFGQPSELVFRIDVDQWVALPEGPAR